MVLHTTSRSLKQVDQFQRDFLGPVLVVLLENIEGVLVVLALESPYPGPYVRILVLDVVLESLHQHRFAYLVCIQRGSDEASKIHVS